MLFSFSKKHLSIVRANEVKADLDKLLCFFNIMSDC
jgi:hypothetical protein